MNGPYRICLFGIEADCSNLGVRALGHSVIGLLLRARPDARIALLCGERQPRVEQRRIDGRPVEIEIVNSRLSPRAKLREHILWIALMAVLWRIVPLPPLRRAIRRRVPWIDRLLGADFIGDIRGGDSFSDIYGFGRLFFGSLPCFIALMLRRPLVLLPQTYGPFRRAASRWIARWILSRACRVYSRDRRGLDEVRALLAGRRALAQPVLCPDVAFTMEARLERPIAFDPPLPNDAQLLIGLNVSGLLYMGGYTHANMFGLRTDYPGLVRALIERLLTETEARVLLVPHQFGTDADESDEPACRAVWEALAPSSGGRLHLLRTPLDQIEVKALIGRCTFFIGSRMHATIAALSQGIPAVGIAYSRKFEGVFETVGVADLALDATTLDGEAILEAILRRWHERERYRAELQARIDHARQWVEQTFSEMLGQPPADQISMNPAGRREAASPSASGKGCHVRSS